MRKIKFSLLDASKHFVGFEKWYPGELNEQGYVAYPQWLYSRDGEYWKPTEIAHRFKRQFTGLKDKNGKEIYEGNIVSCIGGYEQGEDDCCGTVEFITGQWMVTCEHGKTPLSEFDLDKVIVTIYENPELLKSSG